MNLQAARSKFEGHVRRGIFQPVSRHIPHDAEDRMQDAIAQTWAMYRRYAERGQDIEPAILVHSCRLKAQDIGRHFANDGTQKKRDVFDKRNYLDGRVALIDIDVPDRDADADVIPGFAEAMAMNPTRKINSAIDLTAWLETLHARDRKMLELRAAGHTWEETGAAVGMPLRSAYGRCQKLGMELASLGTNEAGALDR
ncbi:MAG TPA: hypothetical protein PLI95_16050 [Polyangiaceae bacterium]|nr:hypothetical protein [Polyangiaceae bacterium]